MTRRGARPRARRQDAATREVRPGAFEPGPRLPDMDVDGITQSVLYPTMLLGLPGARRRGVRRGAGERLQRVARRVLRATRRSGSSASPSCRRRTSSAPCATIRRAKELGHVGVFLRPNPAIGEPQVQRPDLRSDLADLRGARPADRLPSVPGARHAGRLPRPRLRRRSAPRASTYGQRQQPGQPDQQPRQRLLQPGARRTRST